MDFSCFSCLWLLEVPGSAASSLKEAVLKCSCEESEASLEEKPKIY